MKFHQRVQSEEKNKLAKFGDDAISTDEVMTSQNIQHDVKTFPPKMSVLIWNFLDLITLLWRKSAPILARFHGVDHDLQKYRHLQMLFTYDVN